MRAQDFLDLVWPTQGHYCIATPRKFNDGRDGRWWKHKVFTDQDEAMAFAHQHGQSEDQYFAVLTMRQPFLISETKKAEQIKRGDKYPTGKTYRTHENMAWARCFFMDLDVDPTGSKPQAYHDVTSSIVALKEFCRTVQLPRPLMVSSGVGHHCYWPLTEDVSAEDWQPVANKLKKLAAYHEFKVDPTRISDSASVLRVPGTKHLKDPANPRDVRVVFDGDPPMEFALFKRIVDQATILAPTGESYPSALPLPESQLQSSPVVLGQVAKACAQIKHLIETAATSSEPQWYKLLNIVRFVTDGRKWAHEVSKPHAGYDEAETNKKLDQLERPTADGKPIGPSTCGSLSDACGPERCNACWYSKTQGFTNLSSPLVAARRLPKAEVQGVPNPPEPYARVENGILRSGDDPVLICPYDLYPLAHTRNDIDKRRSTRWAIQLPREGVKEFDVSVETLNDVKLLCNALGNAGFVPQFDEAKWVANYMKAYLRELQKYQDSQEQHTHLGWCSDRERFVLPDTIIQNGVVKPALVTEQVRTATQSVRQSGSFEKQRELLSFYSEPKSDYVRHQFMIALSLASPLFYMTGHAGTVVAMTGQSGASKSTALYTAASLWGDPLSFTINGTGGGGTVKGKQNRSQMLSNLPNCIDEVTNMTAEDAKHLVMDFTQQQGPITLTRDRKERSQVGDTKSSLMLVSANNSIHELLAVKNQAGVAGSMRLFEIPTPRVLHGGLEEWEAKGFADSYLADLKKNFGWIGPRWMEWVTAHLDLAYDKVTANIRRIEKLGQFKTMERYWSAVAGVGLFAAEQSYAMGLLPYKPQPIEDWLITAQLQTMRETVSDSYSGPVDQLLAYLAFSANSLIVTRTTAGGGTDMIKHPQGEMAGGYEMDSRRVCIILSHLKAYAARERIPLNGLISFIEGEGIGRRDKVTVGAGTMFSRGQQAVVTIDMKHERISGHARADELSNVVSMGARR